VRRAARAAALSLLVAPLVAAACRVSAQSAGPPAAPPGGRPAAPGAPDMPAVVTDYSADRRSVRDFYTIDSSPTRLGREDALAATWRQRLEALDFDALDQAGRIDWLLLRTELAHGIQRRTARRAKLAESADLLPFAATIAGLEEARWHLATVEPEQAAQTLDALETAVGDVKKRVEAGLKQQQKGKEQESKADQEPEDEEAKTPPPEPLSATPVVARRAASEIDGLRNALSTWFAHYDQFAPGFSWWTRKPYDAVLEALNGYAKLLREEVAGLKGQDEDPLVGDPIGRQALLDDLAGELIAYTPEELLAIGEREFAWCEQQLVAAAGELGLGSDWKAALTKVKENHVEPGEQDALVARQAKEAIAFLDERELVTIPALCRETWRVRMIDRETQRTLPYAAYGGQDMLVAYPTADMDIETRLMTMRGNNVHFSRIVVPHELIPGHHLQGYVAARSNTHRREFSTPFLGEGWALYWELRLWDLGYPLGPEDRVGMLFWRMHRAARIIISLEFHLGQMQPQEMVDFLVDRVGHERAGATSEVRRYIGGDYGPLYQCAYMVGGLQLRALHEELVAGSGAGRAGRLTERRFHDAVLEQNGIPVELIRAALTGAPLTRDWKPAWRFAGEVAPASAAGAPGG
jgi:hypothetical protein